jgi:hypothetical protein
MLKFWEGWRAADPNFQDGEMPSLPVNQARMVAGIAPDFKEYFEVTDKRAHSEELPPVAAAIFGCRIARLPAGWFVV